MFLFFSHRGSILLISHCLVRRLVADLSWWALRGCRSARPVGKGRTLRVVNDFVTRSCRPRLLAKRLFFQCSPETTCQQQKSKLFFFRDILTLVLTKNNLHIQKSFWYHQKSGTAMDCLISVFFANAFLFYRMEKLLRTRQPISNIWGATSMTSSACGLEHQMTSRTCSTLQYKQ